VEGQKNRLAVECHGDQWDGDEAYDENVKSRRILERAGWSFWRIRGAQFYRDSAKTLALLWEKLNEMGIAPEVNNAGQGKRQKER
jgi:very-short-patch-repair endonuclease